MAQSTDLNSVLDTVKRITVKHAYLYTNFEREFRDTISSCNLSDLVNSTIPKLVIHNALRHALMNTADLALEEFAVTKSSDFKTISEQLWSPLIATMISVLFKAVPNPVKKSQGLKSKTEKKSVDPVEKISVSENEIEKIHEKLKSVALTRQKLYANTSYIQCDKDNCAFCSHMFHNVNLTQCKGHKRCNSSGWYPHVGKPLWSQLKTKHASAIPCKLRPKECGPQELPALLAKPVQPRSDETVGIREPEIMDESSQMSFESDTRSICQSLPDTASWADTVEMTIAKKRRIGFQSAPASPAH